jgi:hypothetical protein
MDDGLFVNMVAVCKTGGEADVAAMLASTEA